MTAVLEVNDLTCGYGTTKIVRSVNLELAAGTVLAVLGPNGAGKTTLLLTLAGLLPRLGGDVTVGGHAVRSGRASAANRAGIVLVPDDRALFNSLTVEENLRVARRRNSPPPEQVLEFFPALKPKWRLTAGAMSGGEQQMLAVGRAMIQQPKVLLIDELSMGLAPVIVEDLMPRIEAMTKATGAVVVLVEQHVHLALGIADRAVVLVHGEIALSGTADELRAEPQRLEAAYMGGSDEMTVKELLA